MKKITLLMAALFMAVGMNAQIFQSDFNADTPDTNLFALWTAVDLDGDGQNWEVAALPAGIQASLFTGNVADSDSWEGTAFNPDNLLTTKDPINLTNSTGSTLTYLVGSYQVNGNFIADKYAIYLTASNNPTDIVNATPVVTKLVSDDCACNVADGSASAAPVSIDISAFDGQNVYLTFRHFDTFDENSVLIDDVVVDGTLSTVDSNINGFNYFYSPQTKNLTMTANDAFSNISIYNVLGQEVVAQKLSGTNEVINLSSLKNGVYIANVTANGQTTTFKLIKR